MTWETICKQCGKCCYRLVETESGYSRHPVNTCQFFNKATKQCSVYSRRFQFAPNCREIIEVNLPVYLEDGFLPEDCGYLEYWRTKHGLSSDVKKSKGDG